LASAGTLDGRSTATPWVPARGPFGGGSRPHRSWARLALPMAGRVQNASASL